MEHQLIFLRSAESLLEELQKDPERRTGESWDTEKKINPELLVKFKGPKDQNYISYLKDNYEKSIIETKKEIKKLDENKP